MKQGSGKFQSKNQQNAQSQNNSQMSSKLQKKNQDDHHKKEGQHESFKQSNYLDESKLNQNENQILDQQEMTESQQYLEENENSDQNYRDDHELGNQNQSYNFSQHENKSNIIHASELHSQNNFDEQYQHEDHHQNNFNQSQKNHNKFQNSSQLGRQQQTSNSYNNKKNENHNQDQQYLRDQNYNFQENHKSDERHSRNSSQENKFFQKTEKQHKKSEIHGNPQSWNHIEYDEQGQPTVIQEEVNNYTNYLTKNQNQNNQQMKVNSTSQKHQGDQAKKQKKSEIDGNPTSWNHIEFNEKGDPIIVKQSQNSYLDYVSKQSKKQNHVNNKESPIEDKETLKIDHQEKCNKQSFVSVSSRQDINQSTAEIIPQKINLTYEEYMNQNKDHIQQIDEEMKDQFQKPEQKNPNQQQKKDQKLAQQKNQDKNHKKIEQNHLSSKETQQALKNSTINFLKEDHLDIDQRSVQEHSVITNNMNFDNQTIQDEELRGEYDDTNMNSLIDDKLSTKKMMISDKSFKIDLILNHQPTISPENFRYAENKEKFQLFFQRNADKILKQIQKQGTYKELQNESVIKFQDFQQFINKIFESDNFVIIESEQNRQNIMKNKNISLILSTLLKEFLKTVRKFGDKVIVDEKNFELGIEDMMDFFEFWIRVDDQIQVKYEYTSQQDQENESLSKTQTNSKQQVVAQIENESKEQQKPQQPAFAQARLKSLLEGNIKKLETIQNESIQIDTQQQNIINQTLQFLKSQYKKFEKKSLEDQQNEKVQTILSDTDISLIQQQINSVFKDYSTMFSTQSKKQTFDEIQQSQNFMNINNYFKFVKEFGIQNEKVQGAQIIEIFNRNCTGKQMNYNQFLNSLLKIVEIKENCVFIDQKTQIIAIAKMLKLKISLNSKDNNNKIKKFPVDNSSSTKSIKSQNRSLSPKNESQQSQNTSQSGSESSKLNWSDLEKLSYQQINNLGNKKIPKTEQNLSPQKVTKREVAPKRVIDSQVNKTEDQNKNKKNTDDNFNPNDLIDADDEHETNEILEKQYRITKQAIIRKKSPEREEASPKLPPINGYNSDLSSKPLSEISSKKDSITNVRMIRQITKNPKAQSTSPPPKQIQPINGNIAKSPRLNAVNAYSMRYKNGNGVQSINRGSLSPNIRNTIPSKQPLTNQSAEKATNPKLQPGKYLHNNNNPQQQLQPPVFQQQNASEEQAIQDAILKSTQFRNFLKNRAMQIQNDLLNINQNPQEFNNPTKFQGNEQQQQLQNASFTPQTLPQFQYQQQQQQQQQPQQQNIQYKKNNLPQQPNQIQQQQQYVHTQIQPQSPSNIGMIPQNIMSGNYSFGKINQYANNLNNDLNIPNQAFARGSQLLQLNQHDNFSNSGVRVIPVMNHQGFSQDKMQ